MEDVIIMNGYDLIWKDHDIETNITSFFFREYPITYFWELKNQGWTIFLWWPSQVDFNQYPVNFIPPGEEFYKRLTDKRNAIVRLFTGIIEGSIVQHNKTPFEDYFYFKEYSSASFSISNQEIDPGFTNYTPGEILGFIDPPPYDPNIVYLIITNSRRHREILLRHFQWEAEIGSEDRKTRSQELRIARMRNPGKKIMVIWSPVYNYSERFDYFARVKKFDRPDQDPVTPGVTYYTWGY